MSWYSPRERAEMMEPHELLEHIRYSDCEHKWVWVLTDDIAECVDCGMTKKIQKWQASQ